MLEKFKRSNHPFLNIRAIAFISIYLAVMLIFNFTPQLGYVNIGITAFTTMVIPVTFMSIHYGWKGALLAWFIFGTLYFLQVFASFAGIIGYIGVGGAFVVYFVGRMITGVMMALVLFIFEILEKNKCKNYAKQWWWLTLKIVVVAALGSMINGFTFMFLWYAMDPFKSVVTLTIFLTKFGIAFAIEIPMTIFVSVSSIPLFRYMQQIELNHKNNCF